MAKETKAKEMTYTLGFKADYWKRRLYYPGLSESCLIFAKEILASVFINDFIVLPEYNLEEFINENA